MIEAFLFVRERYCGAMFLVVAADIFSFDRSACYWLVQFFSV